jgi:lipoate-protein ligase A
MGPGAAAVGVALFERLEVIDDPNPRPASFNMAADETLLEQIGDAAVLRIYRWSRPALSLGFFTVFDQVRTPREPREPREWVRRWTGGGIVEHGADFTYSLAVPRRELAALGAGGRSYERIHQALSRALAGAGFAAISAGEAGGEQRAGFRSVPAAHCFEHPVAHDLMIGGRKIAGAAQRRTRRGLLHQGSVQSAGTGPPDWRVRLARSLPEAFCPSPVPRRFHPAEEQHAARLAEEKYATHAWLRRC